MWLICMQGVDPGFSGGRFTAWVGSARTSNLPPDCDKEQTSSLASLEVRWHVACHDKFGPHPFFVPPSPYISKYLDPGPWNMWTPMHVLNYSRDSEGSGAGFWGRVSFQSLYGRVSLQGLHGGSEYFGGPNIMWQACSQNAVRSRIWPPLFVHTALQFWPIMSLLNL